MLKRFLIVFLASLPLAAAAPKRKPNPCAQIDKTKVDSDGVPFCPDIVRQTTAYAVTRCAFNQSRSWHAATEVERNVMTALIKDLKDNKSAAAMLKADKLKLQTCRSKEGSDSFLLMYTKPKVMDYSGPFLMFREGGNTSQIVLHSPHDNQDGTNSSTRAAFANSNALALISNGHPRRASGEKEGPYRSDWAHTRPDLGYTAFIAFKNHFPESVHLHIHGLAANHVMVTDSVGWPSKHVLRTAFIDATEKAIAGNPKFDVFAWRFNGWISGITMTMNDETAEKGDRADNNRWVGAEVAVAIHKNTQILTKMVRNLEEDYLKKPRPITSDLEKEVTPDPDDTEDLTQVETVTEPPPVDLECYDEKKEDAPLESDEVIAMESPAVAASSLPNSIVYAPYPRGNRGVKTLTCVGITYNSGTNSYMTAERCLKTAQATAKFYNENSNGRLKLIPKGEHMIYPGDPWKTFEEAAFVAKKKFPSDYYIIPSLFRKGGNHASQQICWIIQLTQWVVNHELGHLLGMGHSGKYVYNRAGTPSLEAYGDEQSPMGNNGYKFLVGPEYYALGWLGPRGAALFQKPGDTFEITNIKAKKVDGPLFGFVVPAEKFFGKNLAPIKGKHRDAFISFPAECPGKAPACVALHYFGGGGTQRIKMAVSELYDGIFTGIHLKVLSSGNGKIKVSIDFNNPDAVKK